MNLAATTSDLRALPPSRSDGEPGNRESRIENRESEIRNPQSAIHVSLLTGGGDKPYALGIADALTNAGILVDFIGSDELITPELANNPRVRCLNLRGDQRPNANPIIKAQRLLNYYARLIAYAATAKPKLFHILWNNKFQLFDRTLLMLYYRLLGKKVVLTAHNVNVGKRDLNDSWLNRLSLRVQYQLSDHIFVHTDEMKRELMSDFAVSEERVSTIPFGVNNTVPNTSLSRGEAREQIGVGLEDKALLFFGNIAPYKGLEYLVGALTEAFRYDPSYRLIIAGRRKCSEGYWEQIERTIKQSAFKDRVIERIEFVPDEETEKYFKAADVLVLPYTRIFQSGVLFLGYSFGLPAIASDVGSLREEIVEGKTGFMFAAQNSSDLAKTIRRFFDSELFKESDTTRLHIKEYANNRYSWNKVAGVTRTVYSDLLGKTAPGN